MTAFLWRARIWQAPVSSRLKLLFATSFTVRAFCRAAIDITYLDDETIYFNADTPVSENNFSGTAAELPLYA